MALTEQERSHLKLLATDLEFFAEHHLTIIDKDGNITKLKFNRAQRHIHDCLERQLAETGMVRAIIIKGRQQGSSTYVTARFYHKVAFKPAKSVFILSHEASSTEELFEKVEIYHEDCESTIRPGVVEQNSKVLKFDNKSKYRVGTAGAKNTGRGGTAQYLHASEAAYYENVKAIRTGVFQRVASNPGTEIIIESTADGMNWYHKFTMDAQAGKNGYQVIFVPWFWQDEYVMPVPEDFELTAEEEELIELYGLSHEQLVWRRAKISELESDRLFKQEYPCTIEEAFQSSADSFFDSKLVDKARKNFKDNVIQLRDDEPVILGVDPARDGDRTVLAIRKGRVVLALKKYKRMDSIRLANIIKETIDEYDVDRCFIDYGMGYGTIDILKASTYRSLIQGVHFGEAANDDERFMNKRAEMAFVFGAWLKDGMVALPDDPDMASDIASMPQFSGGSVSRIKFPAKDEIKKTYGKSPDILDAIMLTFAGRVRSKETRQRQSTRTVNTEKGSQLTTLSRVRTGRRHDTRHRHGGRTA